jgi:hypothetical protein
LRNLPTIGLSRLPRKNCLSVALGDKIYFFGGDIAYDEVTTDVSCGVIFIFDVTSNVWTEINTTPPREKCSNTLRGVAVGTNIWVLESCYNYYYWHIFDTIQLRWHDTSVQLDERTVSHHSFVVMDNKIIYYDNAMDSDMNVVVLDTRNKTLHPQPLGYGNLPYEREDPLIVALDHETLFMYAPHRYDVARAKKYGEMFYYDMKACKWARADTSKKQKRIDAYMTYLGQFGHVLLFNGHGMVLWTLDLRSFTWKNYAIGEPGAAPQVHLNAMTLKGDKIYCCMSDGQMHAVGLEMATRQQIMTGVIARAKEKLAAVKVKLRCNSVTVVNFVLIASRRNYR